MKTLVFFFALITLLSGCAKISQESIPCLNSKPMAPVVNDVIIPSGGYTYVNAAASSSATIRWSGPNNFSTTTTNGNSLYLDFSSLTNYGVYSAIAYVNGCASDPYYFVVSSSISIPCSVTNANTVYFSTGSSDYFNYSYNSFSLTSSYGQYSIYTYTNNASFGDSWTIQVKNSYYPVSNTYYTLDSTGNLNSPNFGSVIFTTSSGTSHAVSGKFYCTTVGGNKAMVFCNALFKNTQGLYFTVTGAVPFY